MRNEILEYFRKANGNYVSGEQISRDLNVSRTAIWKHINIPVSYTHLTLPTSDLV